LAGLWASLQPWDKDRILQDQDVLNLGRATPEVVPRASISTTDDWPQTPKKLEEFESITEKIAAHSSPHTKLRIRKL